MNIISLIIDFILHMDRYLPMIIQSLGIWTYAVLFFVIFMETGFVVTPFLPGDSLLFAAGAIAALPGAGLNIFVFYVLMAAAAILGDTVNYWIGHFIGPRAFSGNIRFLKKEYLDRTQAFYEKHGGKTILLARFVPIIRTFAPFVAGVGQMRYGHFISYNIFGGILWTALFTFGGFFVGNLEIVRNNFSLIVVAIVLISTIPAIYEFLKARAESSAHKKASAQE
jgi:membrane-associated protein